MYTYKLCKPLPTNQEVNMVRIIETNTCIPFVPDNTDYANFKKEINEDKVQLQDDEGNTMTAAEAKAFVATLP